MRTVLLALPALVLGLAACSSDPPAPSAGSSAQPSSTSPVPADPGASSSTPTASRAPSASAQPTPPADVPLDPLASKPPLETAPPVGLPACAATALTVTDADAVYTSDAVQELFSVRTTGPNCQLPPSSPTVQVLDAAGAALGTVAQGGLGLPAPGSVPLTLSRDTSLSFFVATKRDGACVPAATLVVTLSGTSSALRAPTGLQVCDRTLSVGPLQRLGDTE